MTLLISLGRHAAGRMAAGISPVPLFVGAAVTGHAPPEWARLVVHSRRATVPMRASHDVPPEFEFLAEPLTRRIEVSPRADLPTIWTLIFSSAIPGRENEFNAWYSDRHLGDVVRVPGYVSAQRFTIGERRGQNMPEWRYLAIYEVTLVGYESARAELARRMSAGEVPVSAAAEAVLVASYAPVGGRLGGG